MDLKPRVSLSGEELTSLFFSVSASSPTSSAGSLPIRAPLSLYDYDEEEDDYSDSGSGSGSDSDSEPNFPRIKLSSHSGASSGSETASARSSAEVHPTQETDQVSMGSPKDWIFRPFVASPSGSSSGGPEGAFLEFGDGPGQVGPVPIARVSMEFDDGEGEMRVIEQFEEDGLVIRVPGFNKEGSVEEDDPKRSEVLETNIDEDSLVKDSTVASVCDGEVSESNGVAHGISGGENEPLVEIRPCSDDWNGPELSEVNVGEELPVKGTIESCVSDDEIIGVKKTRSLEMKSFSEDRSVLHMVNLAESLSSEDFAVESSMEEASISECLSVMDVTSSAPWSGLVLVEEVELRDLYAKGNTFIEKVEVGTDSSDFIDCTPSSWERKPKQTAESEQSLVLDLDPENPIPDSVELNDTPEYASVSWISSLAADVGKIAVYDRSSDRDDRSEAEGNLDSKERCNLEKIELLRVKFLRLLDILGCSPEDSVHARALRRLTLALGESCNPLLTVGFTKEMEIRPESEGSRSVNLDFSLNIIVLGKSGVGKSSTINSLLGEQRASIDPLEHATTTIEEFLGTVNGVRVRVLDTPGLRVSATDEALNRRILSAVKKYSNRFPPDIVLYVDRLDSPARDFNDRPVLQTITRFLGSSIWEKAILTLTHAAASQSNEAFVGQRVDVIRSCIDHTAGMNRLPLVSLVENCCRQEVLPNGEGWRIQLLLLCCSVKIMADTSSLLTPRHLFRPWELFSIGESDQDRVERGSTESICVLRDGIICKTVSSLEGEYGPLRGLRIRAGEDENVDSWIKDHDGAILGNCPVLNRADLEASIRSEDRSLSIEDTGDSAIRADIQSRFSLGQNGPKLDVVVGLKDKRRWKVTLRTSSSDSFQVSIIGLLPIVVSVFQFLFHGHGSATKI